MELNVKRFNLNEAAAWVCQQGARRRHGAAVQPAEILVGVRFQAFTALPESCLPAHLLAAVVQCQMQMSRGSCPGFLQVAPPTSLSRGLSVQLDAVLLELCTQQSVVVLQLLNLNNNREVTLANPSCQVYNRLHPSHHRGSLAGFYQRINC